LSSFLHRNETIAGATAAARVLVELMWLAPARPSLENLLGRLLENWLLALVALYAVQAVWAFVQTRSPKPTRAESSLAQETADAQRAQSTNPTQRMGRGWITLAWLVAIAVTAALHIAGRDTSTTAMRSALQRHHSEASDTRRTGRRLVDALTLAIQDLERGIPEAAQAVEELGEHLDRVAMRPDAAGLQARAVRDTLNGYFEARIKGELIPIPNVDLGMEFADFEIDGGQSLQARAEQSSQSSATGKQQVGGIGVDGMRLAMLLASLVVVGVGLGLGGARAQPGCVPLLLMAVTALVGVSACAVALLGREPWTHEWSRTVFGLCGISAACAGVWGLIGWNQVDRSRARELSALERHERASDWRLARRTTLVALLVMGVTTFPFLVERWSTPYGACAHCGRDLGDESAGLGGVAGMAWRKPAEATATWGYAPESATVNVHLYCYNGLLERSKSVDGMFGMFGTPIYRPPAQVSPTTHSIVSLWNVRQGRRETRDVAEYEFRSP
jgi:hypothetical protein